MRFRRTVLWRCLSGIKNKSEFMRQGQKLITKNRRHESRRSLSKQV